MNVPQTSRKFFPLVFCCAILSLVSCAEKSTPTKSNNDVPPASGNARTASHRNTPFKTAPKELPPAGHLETANMEQDILHFVNLHRQSVGLKPLKSNSIESNVAAQHSRNMASGRVPFGHKGLRLRMNAIERQLGSVHTTAENVAYGVMSAKDVVDGWLQSSGHRRNIEGNFLLTGIGIAKDAKGYIYYTQIFTR